MAVNLNAELNRAFLHLDEINNLDWHDYIEKLCDKHY